MASGPSSALARLPARAFLSVPQFPDWGRGLTAPASCWEGYTDVGGGWRTAGGGECRGALRKCCAARQQPGQDDCWSGKAAHDMLIWVVKDS